MAEDLAVGDLSAWRLLGQFNRLQDGLISILFDFGCTFKGQIHLNFKKLNFEVYV